MHPQDLRDRTKAFTVAVIRFAKTSVARDPAYDYMALQLAEAAGATGAAYRAACRPRSRKDFIYKLGNAIEECDESAFWLEVLMECDAVPRAKAGPLWQEADELTRILVKSRETARKRARAKRTE